MMKKNNNSKAFVLACLTVGAVVVLFSLIFKLYRWQHYLIAAGVALLAGRIVYIMAQGLDTSNHAPSSSLFPRPGIPPWTPWWRRARKCWRRSAMKTT